MPYVSAAQRGWAHTPAGMKALGGPAKVAEWDAASKGLKLPARASKTGNVPMPKRAKTLKVKKPKAAKIPRASVKPVHGTPLAGVLGFNAAKKIPNPLLG